jgi:hypothetical protein
MNKVNGILRDESGVTSFLVMVVILLVVAGSGGILYLRTRDFAVIIPMLMLVVIFALLSLSTGRSKESKSATETRNSESTDGPTLPTLEWQSLNSSDAMNVRAKVPGGWLLAGYNFGALFYPDPDHKWNGGSL